MVINSEYNMKENQLELTFSNEKLSSFCILKDEWDSNYRIDSLIGWFNHILKQLTRESAGK